MLLFEILPNTSVVLHHKKKFPCFLQNIITSLFEMLSFEILPNKYNKTDHHDITEMLLKVALNTIKPE